MPQKPHAGEHHRAAMLVDCRDHFFVFDRTAGLNDRFDALLGVAQAIAV
jgi:hypothetical protein